MADMALPAPARFFVVSTSDRSSMEEMKWDGGVYRYAGQLTTTGQSFQILKDGSWNAIVHPSVNNASPTVAHVLAGPSRSGHGFSWTIPAAARGAPSSVYEVVLSCPKGFLLSIAWSRRGESPDSSPSWELSLASDDHDGQRELFKKNFGQFQLRSELGRGKQRGAVFLAEGRGRDAAVKYPVSLLELQHLSAVRGVGGVPELLDYGNGPEGGPFHATPVFGGSLERILERCERDGVGGRMSWPAAQALGRALLATLRGIHGRGVIHCDISPHNVLMGEKGRPYLIDFGLSRAVGGAYFSRGEGTFEYNSVRGGYPGRRSPADDLESLGWLLWRCVFGPLPWHKVPQEIAWHDRAARQRVSERISKMKKDFLDGGSGGDDAGPARCPASLKAYLRHAWRLTTRDSPDVHSKAYAELQSYLESPEAERCWADVVESRPRTFYEAESGKVHWRPPATRSALDAETLECEPHLRLVCTGRMERLDGGRWAELDPVWMPGLPAALCEQGGWVLVADWGGKILQRVAARGGHLEDTQTEYSAVQQLTEEEEGDFGEEQERELQAA
eukprot:CAMPEP_0179356236 /NCGR_PEP_ID=MMETSP0797-20121207/77783_1 /TAXON_ID=47934 /ORGANISM="Dinophysis acuminata, Strain DAEP01" /LENGTH=559 /DNA_ID=CAMNT_0021071405 /DNA_START=98 /DNA_END=1773 /DNA_ORIENTATION=-